MSQSFKEFAALCGINAFGMFATSYTVKGFMMKFNERYPKQKYSQMTIDSVGYNSILWPVFLPLCITLFVTDIAPTYLLGGYEKYALENNNS